MKTRKLLIFIIAIAFLMSVSFAFAADENVTQISEADDIPLEMEDVSQDTLESSPQDTVAAETDGNTDNSVKTIKMGKVTKRYNGIIQYQATFYDSSGNPLKNTNVLFEVDDGSDYSSTTDSNGIALLTIYINKGSHKIAALNPQSMEIDSAYIKVFDVLTGSKDINMYYDGGNTYKVRVFDDNGNPAKAGEKVTFAVGKKTYTKKTDKKGYAKLKITSKPGLYEIGAKYKDFVVKNQLYVKQVIKPITEFKSKAVKKTIRFKVKFLGKNKKNKKITVKFNKKVYKAKTNKKGIATFNLKTPKKVGKYNVVSSYKKSKMVSVYYKYYA